MNAGRRGTLNSIVTRTVVPLALAVLLLSMTSCVCVGERVELVELRTEEQTIDLGGAERVVIEVEIGIGKLSIKGDSPALLDAKFTYNTHGRLRRQERKGTSLHNPAERRGQERPGRRP